MTKLVFVIIFFTFVCFLKIISNTRQRELYSPFHLMYHMLRCQLSLPRYCYFIKAAQNHSVAIPKLCVDYIFGIQIKLYICIKDHFNLDQFNII